MLAKKYRLNLSLAENSQMFKDKTTQRFTNDNLLFYFRSNSSFLKITAIAPSRLFVKAHQRNQQRRLIYNLILKMIKKYDKQQKLSFFNKKFDIIVVYKNKDFKKNELEKDLNYFFETVLTNK